MNTICLHEFLPFDALGASRAYILAREYQDRVRCLVPAGVSYYCYVGCPARAVPDEVWRALGVSTAELEAAWEDAVDSA